MSNREFKIVLLGEGCVGKTSLALRYVEDKFNDKHLTTVQASFLSKKLNVSGRRVTLNIWDTAGQERFHALGPIYYRDSDGAILVYDITDEDSFEKARNWVKELRKIRGNDVTLYLVGNKIDLERDRHVPLANAEEFASSVGAKHCGTSAKLNRGVEEAFARLTADMLARRDAEEASNPGSSSRSSTSRSEGATSAGRRSSGRNAGIIVGEDDVDGASGAGGGKCC
ncbi:hypothetical protein BOX15_Mlig008977g1 [Macrostomum lignano]|uniref:Ras-related protein Rab-21 n=1 Tax=Macrostomum lignano TaxID=282301 RepID=A0A267DP56_9PLAT|nr:hypothetical protein BOX15_Mlig008977g4 [Macrostomum lignano]PAA50342.1 hypothetical protein BOX15_Mlig008977g3 [Macrostomum lignano]PAA63763.1 hypothetical protein BOX15_Mlig008977g2 [Macrostomum lignano]PAA63779.1 hypothetical protein BOX15_Mlig008977g1 [Macrostomum lignano]